MLRGLLVVVQHGRRGWVRTDSEDTEDIALAGGCLRSEAREGGNTQYATRQVTSLNEPFHASVRCSEESTREDNSRDGV